MRVLVADDHSLFRDGIVSLMQAAGFTVVGQFGNGLPAERKQPGRITNRCKSHLPTMDLETGEHKPGGTRMQKPLGWPDSTGRVSKQNHPLDCDNREPSQGINVW